MAACVLGVVWVVGALEDSRRSSTQREVAIVLFSLRLLPTHFFASRLSRFSARGSAAKRQMRICLGGHLPLQIVAAEDVLDLVDDPRLRLAGFPAEHCQASILLVLGVLGRK